MTIVLDGSAGITNDGGYTGDGVVFADTTPANTLVTTTGGNVGIGTSSPSYPLDVAGAMRGNSWIGRANVSAPTADAAMYRAADNTLAFSTANTERARIDSSGNLLVGTTTASGLIATTVGAGKVGYYTNKSSAGGGLDHAQYYTDGSLQGKITQTGGFTTVSDYRLKSDVVPLSGMLEKVCKLKPVSYTLTAFGQQQFGFIAHELQEELAVFVDGAKDAVNEDGSIAPQSVDYSKIVSVLTAAIQEQQAIITAQAAQIQQLREKVLEVEEGTSNMLVENTNNLHEIITALTARVAALEGK